MNDKISSPAGKALQGHPHGSTVRIGGFGTAGCQRLVGLPLAGGAR